MGAKGRVGVQLVGNSAVGEGKYRGVEMRQRGQAPEDVHTPKESCLP